MEISFCMLNFSPTLEKSEILIDNITPQRYIHIYINLKRGVPRLALLIKLPPKNVNML